MHLPHRPIRRLSHHLSRHGLLVLLAVAVLVGCANVAAYAASGRPLLVGRANVSGVLTAWARSTDGPVVGFKPQPGSPPFTTSSDARVLNLDADQVDGKDAGDLVTGGFRYEIPPVSEAITTLFSLPGLPRGRYLATYSVLARTPDGDLTCGWTTEGPRGGFEGLAFGVRRFRNVSVTSSAVIDTREVTPQLWCTDHSGPRGHGFEIAPDALARSSISLVRLDTVHDSLTTASRPRP